MRILPDPRTTYLRTFTSSAMVASGLLFLIGCFLPAAGAFKNEEPIDGIWALLFGWFHLIAVFAPAYRENLGQNVGTVWIANLFFPITLYFLFFAPRDFKIFAVALAVAGTGLATRAFTVFGYEHLFSGFYFWLASFVAFTAGTTGAVVDELSR